MSIYLQVKSRPGSSQVSSAAASDMEAEGSTEQQHTLGKVQRKRHPDHADHELKRCKDSVSAGQHTIDIDEIDRDVRRCNDVSIKLLKTKKIEPEEVIKFLHSRVCQCIAHALDQELVGIRHRIIADCERKRGPFKDVTRSQLDAIEGSQSVFELMKHHGILDKWLNTTLLHFFISLSRRGSPQDEADYWLQQYLEILSGFCRKFLMRELPVEYCDQLRIPKIHQEHHRTLRVVYDHMFAQFTLADLLKEIDFLQEALEIPADVMTYLQAIPSNSVAVYWLFDMSYAAHSFFDVHQLFWPLLEHRVLSLELGDVMTISLRGNHVSYLIKNALQTGQNLIQQTKVCAMEHMLLYV